MPGKFSKKSGVGVYSFFVLGLVPGTDIQISFLGWMGLTCLVFFSCLLLWSHLLHTRRPNDITSAHVPLHASQLHQRLRLAAR